MFKKNNQNIGAPAFMGALMVMLSLLVGSIIFSIYFGAVKIDVNLIVKILENKLFGIGTLKNVDPAMIEIVFGIRFPRIILATIVGIGLAISGVVMQAVVKNSLADPYILGVSSGAALGATLAIVLGIGTFLGANYVGLSACFTAFGASILVMAIANFKGRANPIKLVMAGVAVSSMLSAFSSFIIYTASDREGIKSVSFWLMGGLAGANWKGMGLVGLVVLLGLIFFMSQYRILNLMLLGDDASITLGKDLNRYRQVYMLVVSIIIGFLVYNAGIIGFVGLIMPHVSRLFFGTDHRRVLCSSAILGALLMIWADVLSRTLLDGTELPVGVLISLVGAPAFVYLLVNKEYGFGGDN